MSVGRKPKPTAQKILEGNPGKRELNENEPKYALASSDILPPDDMRLVMSEIALDEWKRVAPGLVKNGILTDMDLSALFGYCLAFSKAIDAARLIELNGMIYETQTKEGAIMQRKSPMIDVLDKALGTMKSFMCEFGMTPSSRSKIITPQLEKEEDPMEGLLKRVK